MGLFSDLFGSSSHTQQTTSTSNVTNTQLAGVKAPTLLVMGEKDPDFPDPKAEAAWIAEVLHGQTVMVPEAGHYPQSQQPDITGNAILGWLTGLGAHA